MNKLDSNLEFSVNLDANPQIKPASRLKVLDIVRRSPAILNKRWGNKPPCSMVYSQVIEDTPDKKGESNLPQIDTELSELGEILPHFPILRELVTSVRAQCQCGWCEEDSLDDDINRVIKEGCFSHQALVEVMVLVSHGIADSLGVNDASSHRDKDSLVKITARLLGEVAAGRIKWNDWFHVSCSVLLGCSFLDASGHLCAIQHGNLAAIAGWLDLNQDLEVQGCFSLRYGEGKLGTLNDLNNELRSRGVVGDFLIVSTEATEPVTINGIKKLPKPKDPPLHMIKDDSKVESDHFLVNIDRQNYRLLTRIRTNHYSRLIDPFDTIQGIARSPPSYVCSHNHLCRTPCKSEDCIAIFSFDDLLGQWGCSTSAMHFIRSTAEGVDGSTYHLSQLLDSPLKINVAYALSMGNNMIIGREGACAGCSLAYWARFDQGDRRAEDIEGGRHARFIVNAMSGKKKVLSEASK